MSSNTSPPSASLPNPGSPRASGVSAIFTLDQAGSILSANATAGQFWQSEPGDLVGKPFVGLFAFEVVSDDPDMLEAQWDVLNSSATEQRIPLSIQLVEDGHKNDVRVELEPAAGGDSAWFARIERTKRLAEFPQSGRIVP